MPSEDPFHSGAYGVAYTKGLQWGDDPKYTKAIGALKHYTICPSARKAQPAQPDVLLRRRRRLARLPRAHI